MANGDFDMSILEVDGGNLSLDQAATNFSKDHSPESYAAASAGRANQVERAPTGRGR